MSVQTPMLDSTVLIALTKGDSADETGTSPAAAIAVGFFERFKLFWLGDPQN